MGKKRNRKRRTSEAASNPLVWPVAVLSGLALVALLAPSLIRGFSLAFSQSLAFMTAVELAFGLWLVLAVSDARYRPKFSWIGLALLVYVGTMILAAPFGLDLHASFWSNSKRMTGIVFHLHCLALFVTLTSLLRTRHGWRSLLTLQSGLAALVSAIAIFEWLGDTSVSLVDSLLGNSSYLAAYLVPSLFLQVYLALDLRGGARKLAWLAAALTVPALLLTGSRAAALALALTVILLLLAHAGTSELSRRARLAIAGISIGLAVLAVGTYAVLRLPSVSSSGLVPGFVQRLSNKNIGEDRALLWSLAAKGIAERPVFGWGQDQFMAVMFKHLDPYGVEDVVLYERWNDRVHNQHLDTLVAYGAVGFAGGLLLWLTAFVCLLRRMWRSSDNGERRRLAVLTVALVVTAVYTALMFETPGYLAVMYLTFALMAAETSGGRDRPEVAETVPDFGRAKVAALFVVPLVLALVWSLGVTQKLKAAELGQAIELYGRDRTEATVVLHRAMSGFNPYVTNYRLKAISYLMPWAESVHLVSDQMRGLMEEVTSQLAYSAEREPHNTRTQMAAAVMHRLMGEYDESYLDRAEEYHERLLEIAPGHFGVYQEIAEVQFLRGDYDGALKSFGTALDMTYARKRDHQRVIYYRMACVHAAARDFGRMFAALAEAEEMSYKSRHDSRLATVLGEAVRPGDDLTGIEDYLSGVLESYPDHPQLLEAAARIYVVLGDEGSARSALDRLAQRNEARASELREELGIE